MYIAQNILFSYSKIFVFNSVYVIIEKSTFFIRVINMLDKKERESIQKSLTEFGFLNYHVLESMVDWVRLVSHDGTIVYANKAMKDALGYDIVGKKCFQSVGRDTPCNFCISKRSILNGEVVQKEEMIKGRYYSVISSPIRDVNGKIVGAVEVLRDVTRERKLEQQLVRQNAKMLQDIKFAEKIQRKILPKKGIYKTLKIDYIYKPCEMLSGDMFDVFYIDEDNIGIYICDVAGHGITSSIMTMFVRQTMRAIKENLNIPSKTLTELQKRFITLGLESDKYFTMFYAVYNIKDHSLKYANAGHNCVPIKYNSHSIEFLNMKGLPISLIFNEIFYEESEIILSKGDKILFFTDGIVEVKDRNKNQFGVDRIIDIIKAGDYDILDKIIGEVEKFRWGEQMDDYALLLMEVIE